MMKKVFIISICVLIVVCIGFGVKYLISVNEYKKEVKNISIKNVDLEKVENGQYVGSCDVGYIKAVVKVQVKDHKIMTVKLLEHKNERGKKAEAILGKVIKAQSVKVDTITGATNSSKVILRAIESALQNGEKA